MAKIASIPSVDIVNGFKGVLDYYVHRGIPCVRRWPRYTPRTPTPPEAAAQTTFSTAIAEWPNLAPIVRDAYNTMASGSTLSGRDMFVKMYINSKVILPY